MLCKYRNTIQYIIQLNLYKVLRYRNIHIKYKKNKESSLEVKKINHNKGSINQYL